MKYTALGESWAANMWSAIFVTRDKTLTKSCMLSYKGSGSALSVLLYLINTYISINQIHLFEI